MPHPSQPLPPKKEVALALLERSSVFVHLDPRATAVVVPPWFKKQAQLVLQIGLNMPVPIPDLRLDDDSLTCTLSFNRSPFYCVVPWASVFAMVGEDGRGMVWPGDVPAEVARQAQGRATDGAARKETKPAATDGKGEAPAKAKRSRKRAQPPQPPALAVVPEPKGRESKASRQAARTDEIVPPAPRPAAAQSSRSRKSKRELPPYLRVVK